MVKGKESLQVMETVGSANVWLRLVSLLRTAAGECGESHGIKRIFFRFNEEGD